MIDITKAQAEQSTVKGSHEDWIVSLDGEELYKLPAHFTVADTFIVRDVVEAMMKRAEKETKEQEQQMSIIKMQRLVTQVDAQLEALKQENIRISNVLQQHLEAA